MSLVEIHSDFSHFLAENVSSCMNKFYTQERFHYDAKLSADEENWPFQFYTLIQERFYTLIQERFHYDAKLSADEENWPFQTRITMRSH